MDSNIWYKMTMKNTTRNIKSFLRALIAVDNSKLVRKMAEDLLNDIELKEIYLTCHEGDSL